MAPAAVVTQTQAHPHKKRAPPPGLTGLNSSTSSPSPSIASKRLPPSNSHGSATVNGNGIRSANRARRDGSNQLLGRGQRNHSGGLKSANMTVEIPTWMEVPYVKDEAYILKKFSGHRPSLIIHLFPTTFRFDNQHGSFSYKSPMKFIIEHMQSQTIPHDLMLTLLQAGVMFYDGCLIVQVEDHKSMAPKPDSSSAPSSNEKSKLSTIHNWNPNLTVSPYMPFPPEAAESSSKSSLLANASSEDSAKLKSSNDKDKENMPAPANSDDSKPSKSGDSSKQPKIFTTVLFPTPQTEEIRRVYEFAYLKAGGQRQEGNGQAHVNTPLSAIGPRPPTPMTAVPATPRSAMEPPAKKSKRDKVEATPLDYNEFQATAVLANSEPLYLEPVESPADLIALMEKMTHPRHSAKLPSSPPRKRTIAQMAADEAAAAQAERIMLWNDDRLSSTLLDGVTNAGIEGQTGSDYRFSQLKVIESQRVMREEKKKEEKLRQEADALRRAQQQENESRERAKQIEQHKREIEDKNRAVLQQRQQMQAQAAEQQRLQIAREQSIQNRMQNGHQMNQGHGHPAANGMQNGNMQAGQQAQRFHAQQVSQAQQASPVVRNGTPHNMSSPMVPNGSGMGITPMQHTTSSMGGSPSRPGSAAQQNHPMAMGHPMAAQRSQQSHAGTPRMPNATPNIPNATPINRQMNATPRMSQASPLPGSMAPQMPGQVMMHNGVPLNPQQMHHMYQAQQQQQQARLQQQHAMNMNMNPEMMRMQVMRQQQAQAQAQAQGMTPQQVMERQVMERQYAQQVRILQQSQMPGGMGGPVMHGQGMGNPQMPGNGQMQMNPNMRPQPQGTMATALAQKAQLMYNNQLQKGVAHLQSLHGPNVPPELLENLKVQTRNQIQQWRQSMMHRQAQHLAMQQQGMAGHQANMGMGQMQMGQMGQMGMGQMGPMGRGGMQPGMQ